MKLESIIDFNPRTPIEKGAIAPFADMASLPTGDRYFPISTVKEFKGSGSKFRDGDTLLARITPCLENGKGGFVKGLGVDVSAHGSTEFIIFRARQPTDTDFVFYISKHPDFRKHAIKQMSGTSGRQRVAWQSLTGYEIHDLSAPEREEIGYVLSALDDKIELNRGMNETLEGMARAIFKDWFVTFGPTRAKMAGAEPYLVPEIWNLFPDKLDDEGKPEGWKEKPLSEFGDIVTGKTPSTKRPEYFGGDIPFLKIPDMHGNMYVLETKTTLSKTGAYSQKNKTLPTGSVSVSCIATPGLVVLNHCETQTNQQINSIVPFDKLASKFVYWSCRTLSSEVMTGGSGGSVFHNMNKTTFSALNAVHPGNDLIKEFGVTVEEIHSKILLNELESRTLAKTRDLLLPKLMSGEIRVRGAEKQIQESG